MVTNMGFGDYRKEDYEEILRISEDRNDMDEDWNIWRKKKEKAKARFQKMGYMVMDVTVIPKELLMYCRMNGLEVNGKARSEFVQSKMM